MTPLETALAIGQGQRLPRPTACPHRLHTFMVRQLWHAEPSHRMSMVGVAAHLKEMAESLEFDDVVTGIVTSDTKTTYLTCDDMLAAHDAESVAQLNPTMGGADHVSGLGQTATVQAHATTNGEIPLATFASTSFASAHTYYGRSALTDAAAAAAAHEPAMAPAPAAKPSLPTNYLVASNLRPRNDFVRASSPGYASNMAWPLDTRLGGSGGGGDGGGGGRLIPRRRGGAGDDDDDDDEDYVVFPESLPLPLPSAAGPLAGQAHQMATLPGPMMGDESMYYEPGMFESNLELLLPGGQLNDIVDEIELEIAMPEPPAPEDEPEAEEESNRQQTSEV
jgi:hypothetical protein